jgi:predicted secreted protein
LAVVEESSVRTVNVEQKFDIDLEAVPGGGYVWSIAQSPNEIELISKDVVSISKEIGGNSLQRFTLLAHRPGNYSLIFELKRSWEKKSTKTAVFTIHVS